MKRQAVFGIKFDRIQIVFRIFRKWHLVPVRFTGKADFQHDRTACAMVRELQRRFRRLPVFFGLLIIDGQNQTAIVLEPPKQ